MARRTVGIVTTTRAEYGILRSLIRAVADDPDLELRLIVSGTHLSEAHGMTVREIERDGVPIWRQVPILADGDDEVAALLTIANAIAAQAPLLADTRPDILVVLGDRSEVIAWGLVALLLRIPLAHLHGGEVTAGAVDESIRHALTKLATWHFVATDAYAANVRQLGEDPDRVYTVGAPGLDGLVDLPTLGRAELLSGLGLAADRPTALVALHPETTRPAAAAAELADAVLAGLAAAGVQAVLTGANADAGGALINARFAAAAAREPGRCCFRPSLGRELFGGCLRRLDVMVGNSSAGVIEAPSFGRPVVNVGDRQLGRVMADGIIQAPGRAAAIADAIGRALTAEFGEQARRAANPYAGPGMGRIGVTIKDILKSVPLGPDVIRKRFHELDGYHA
ncbi:MAG: UDP-N-acetylglucosamine 2-epimerase [Candidatus Krumholzibacteriia bacterium]